MVSLLPPSLAALPTGVILIQEARELLVADHVVGISLHILAKRWEKGRLLDSLKRVHSKNATPWIFFLPHLTFSFSVLAMLNYTSR